MSSSDKTAEDASKSSQSDVESQRDCTRLLIEVGLPCFLVLTFVCGIVVFVWIGPLGVLRWLLSFMPENPGLWHAVILGGLIVFFIVILIPLWPPLMIVTGMVFGFWNGLCICTISMILGALLSFLLGRTLLRDAVRDYVEQSDYSSIRRIMHIVEEDGNSLKFMFLFRFLFIPIWIRNYLPSLFNISVWVFLLPVCVHSLWICTIFAAVGATTKDLAEAAAGGKKSKGVNKNQLLIFGAATVSMILISILAYREYAKKLEEEESASLVPADRSASAQA
eukprot:TRINITY_DN9872_c0_g1_i1.p1 TRINITY_DN9872_c0_g1~~TRINITY_DN9872_c0_g1_i1.p1  ORF type:complete len:279 (-),score=43.19 TRINITY_DN9872_c0_g1_i1:117-953(-)